MLQPKFIIQDGELRMGRVEMHYELAKKDDDSNVKGGGYWHYEKDTDVLYLYGKSFDYGRLKVEDFEDVWLRPSLEESTVYFSLEDSLIKAKKNNVLIQDLNLNDVSH